MKNDLAGCRFGRWLVLSRVDAAGAARWLCRCDCGTQRDVAERSLLSGASKSCGCIAREKKLRADLTGEHFGRLTVLARAGKSDRGIQQWRCMCDCGQECTVLHTSLREGKRTSCGCDSQKGRHGVKDVTGQRFHMLTALCPTARRGHGGSIVWRCQCDCGNETEVSLDKLQYGSVISCGCMREKRQMEIAGRLVHVADTSIDALRSDKIRTDNQTGVTGVFVKRGRYCTTITFQKKTYYLGSYRQLEQAAQVRKEAERELHRNTVLFYEKWADRAQGDACWAADNPISISVQRRENGEFELTMLPEMEA